MRAHPAADFPGLLSSFLTVHLPVTRGCAANTVRSYRDTAILLLRFLQTEHRVSPDQVAFDDLTAARIEGFAAWLHTGRGCAPATANQRLAAVKSFLRYAQTKAPELIAAVKPVLAIPAKKTPQPAIACLTRQAVATLLETAKRDGGLRDLALLACLYASAARVQEIADLDHGDLHADKPIAITVTGKGSKTRTIPLPAAAGDIVVKHARSRDAETGDPLFANRQHARLTRAGIAHILARHTTAAASEHPETIPGHVTPHVLRHSRAMHLLEDGHPDASSTVPTVVESAAPSPCSHPSQAALIFPASPKWPD